MYQALFISPMIPSTDVTATARFFSETLGFSIEMDSPLYSVLKKDGLTIHIEPAGNPMLQMEFYMEVNDIEGLWTAMKDKVVGLKVREPFDRDYGMREVHLEVPYTCTLLFIGQALK